VDEAGTAERWLRQPARAEAWLSDVLAQTPAIEAWRSSLTTAARIRNKQPTILNGIFRRAQKRFGLQRNPVGAGQAYCHLRLTAARLLERCGESATIPDQWWTERFSRDSSKKLDLARGSLSTSLPT
jgi:hypothetical protein